MVEVIKRELLCPEFLNCCRVCALKSKNLVSLFEKRKNGNSCAEMISHSLQIVIEESDPRPQDICKICIYKLNVVFKFQNLVKTSEEKFQQIVSSYQSEIEQQNNVDVKQSDLDYDIEYKEDCEDFQSDDSILIEESVKLEEIIDDAVVDKDKNQDIEPIIEDENVLPELEENKRNGKKRRKRKGKVKETKNDKEKEVIQKILEEDEECIQYEYECYKCKKVLKKTTFRRHMKEHIANAPHKCKVCEMHFSNDGLQHHLCKGNSVQCKYCGESFTSTLKFSEHLECHLDYQSWNQCEHCDRVFPFEILLEWHLWHHFKIKLYSCDACNRGFWARYAYQVHMNSHKECMHIFIFSSFLKRE